jgi:hypothetical protein
MHSKSLDTAPTLTPKLSRGVDRDPEYLVAHYHQVVYKNENAHSCDSILIVSIRVELIALHEDVTRNVPVLHACSPRLHQLYLTP